MEAVLVESIKRRLASEGIADPDDIFGVSESRTDAIAASLPGPARVRYLDLARLKAEGIPPIEWLVQGWLQKGDVAILAGAGGIGKSTALAALAHALARGEAWCGIEISEPMSVLVFDEEQGEDETGRLYLRLGDPHPNLKIASGAGINLSSDLGVDALEREIADHKPQVVFLDSVQQVFGSAKENDATEIGAVYRRIFRLRDLYGTAFVLVHHKRKSQASMGSTVDALELVRGSTAHGTQASTVWYCYPGQDSSRLNIVQAKRRGSSKTSLVVAYSSDGPEGSITLTGEGPVDDADTALGQAQEWIVTYLAEHDVAKKAWITDAAKGSHNETRIERALKTLVRLDKIRQPQRGYYELVPSSTDDGNLMER